MRLFVFPISNVVFFPATSKPLNIFEPRYIQMVEDALQTQTPIALALMDDAPSAQEHGKNLPFVRPVAGYGVPLILEKRSDGTMLIFLQAAGKALLGPLQKTDTPYLVVEAEPIPENQTLSAPQVPQLLTLQKLLTNWVQRNISEVEVRENFLGQLKTPEEILSSAASFLLQDSDLQQAVLEANSLDSKINLLIALLSSAKPQ